MKELPECYGYLAIGYLQLGDLTNAHIAMQTQLDMGVETKNEPMQRMALLNLGENCPAFDGFPFSKNSFKVRLCTVG